jgi:hypothetical protein
LVGRGGSTMTLGATFDGEPVVVPKEIPIATDVWSGEYATTAGGGCAVGAGVGRSSPRGREQGRAPGHASAGAFAAVWLFVVACARPLRRRHR